MYMHLTNRNFENVFRKRCRPTAVDGLDELVVGVGGVVDGVAVVVKTSVPATVHIVKIDPKLY